MRRIAFLPVIVLLAACASPEADANPQTSGSDSELEGIGEYVGDLIDIALDHVERAAQLLGVAG